MKIAAYEVRPDEKPVIESMCKEYGIELISTPANLDKTTANMAAGCDGVTTLGQSDYCNEVLDELKGYGVQVLASRCVGYNHMNCDYARSLGFRLCNGAYAPNGVAEYTVMAILMCIRKFKKALYNTNDNDFTLKGKMGRELRTMTVGVMGTGKIGYTVIKCLSGFGCRILANDVYENDAVRRSSTADGTQCFHTFPSVRSSRDGDFPLIAQSFRAGSMAAASPAAIMAATCSSV